MPFAEFRACEFRRLGCRRQARYSCCRRRRFVPLSPPPPSSFSPPPRSSRRRPGFLPPPRTSTAAPGARIAVLTSLPALLTAAWPVSGFSWALITAAWLVSGFSWALITAAVHFRGADCGYCADFSGANSRPPSQGRWVLLLLRFPAAVAFSLGFRILKPSYSHREFSGQKTFCASNFLAEISGFGFKAEIRVTQNISGLGHI